MNSMEYDYENDMVLSVIKSTMITLRNIYHLYNMNTIIIIYR